MAEGLEELEEEEEKILAIGVALNQYTEEGDPITYREQDGDEVINPEDNIITDLEKIEEQGNLIQIDLENEKQYIFKPCQDKSEYNRSIRLLSTSGMISLEEATRRSINTVFAQLASEIGGERLSTTAKRIGIESELDPVISLTLGAVSYTHLTLPTKRIV